MKQGLAIAATTYRVMLSSAGVILMLGAIPLMFSTGLAYWERSIEGFGGLVLYFLHGVVLVVYVAALMRVFLMGAPVSLRTLRVGDVEWHMFMASICLGALYALMALGLGSILGVFSFLPPMTAVPLIALGGYFAARYSLTYPFIVAQTSRESEALNKSWRATQGYTGVLVISGLLTIGPLGMGLRFAVEYAVEILGASSSVWVLGVVIADYINATVVACLSAVAFQTLVPSTERS